MLIKTRQILTFCCALFFFGVTCPSGFCAAEGESFRYDPRFYESRIYWENFSIFQKFSLWIYSIFCQNAVQATFLVNRSNEHTILFPGWDVIDIYIKGDSSNFWNLTPNINCNTPTVRRTFILSFGLLFSKSLCTDKNTQSLLFRTKNQQGGPHIILCCDTIKFIPIILQLMTFHSWFCSFFIHKINIQDSASNMPIKKKSTDFHEFKIWRCTLNMLSSDISLWK